MEWWTSEYWSDTYQKGNWDYLWDKQQLRRYQIIHQWCKDFSSRSVLDIGCGEGVLLRSFPRENLNKYLGLDFSPEAIKLAKQTWKKLPCVNFQVFDANKLIERKWDEFDTIIFNEVLYSLQDPITVLHHFLTEKKGFVSKRILISIYYKEERLKNVIRNVFHRNLVDEINALNGEQSGGWYLLALESRVDNTFQKCQGI